MLYWFRQNNTGGYFCDPAINVMIEAGSASEANDLAQKHGVYFNGATNGKDCGCCGDRWYEVTEGNALNERELEQLFTNSPTMFGDRVQQSFGQKIKGILIVGNVSDPSKFIAKDNYLYCTKKS